MKGLSLLSPDSTVLYAGADSIPSLSYSLITVYQNWGKIETGQKKNRYYCCWPKGSPFLGRMANWLTITITCLFPLGWQVSYLLCCHARSPDSGKVFTATGTQHRAVVSWPEGNVAYKRSCCFIWIGPLHDPVTWHGINYTATLITQWDFQNKGKPGCTGTSFFVWEVPLRNLRLSVIYSVPCDRIVRRAYCFLVSAHTQTFLLLNINSSFVSAVLSLRRNFEDLDILQ